MTQPVGNPLMYKVAGLGFSTLHKLVDHGFRCGGDDG